ncbi:MAG: hypothetical protein JSV86_16210 [Gemmatimonadota bacterium]|nr:MAG: hypothetical protein JSV86_16210 [Gemmatimonadota bacterium]
MDLYCTTPGCGEPWDSYEIQTCLADELGITSAAAVKLFRRKGCAAFPGSRCDVDADATPNLRSMATAELLDLMPDDVDGVAAMLDDFDAIGLL